MPTNKINDERVNDAVYRNVMYPVIENLAITLDSLGYTKAGSTDAELVAAATKKLKLLHSMMVASGFNTKLLEVIMNAE